MVPFYGNAATPNKVSGTWVSEQVSIDEVSICLACILSPDDANVSG